MSALEDVREQLSRLEEQEKLEYALTVTGEVCTQDPSPENLAAHNKAAEVLAAHRSASRLPGVRVGGDVIVGSGE